VKMKRTGRRGLRRDDEEAISSQRGDSAAALSIGPETGGENPLFCGTVKED
jgi:hypothetical protein